MTLEGAGGGGGRGGGGGACLIDSRVLPLGCCVIEG